MRMLWFGMDNSQASGCVRRMAAIELRDGLEPALATGLPNYAKNFTNHTGVYNSFSPDQTKGVIIANSNSNSLTFYIADSKSETVTPTTAAWSGQTYDSFCGNTIYGFAGNGSLLTVFDWATHSLITINKTGLGTVLSCSLSDDETKLAITHSTSPFVRVYDTSTWAYTDAASAGVNSSYCEWTKTGNHLLCVSTTAAHAIYKYNPNLSTKTIISNSNQAVIDTYGTIISFTNQTKGESIVVNTRRGSINQFKLYEVNCGTDAITHFIPVAAEGVTVNAATYDPIGEKIYCSHDPINLRYFSSYDANTFVRDPEFNGLGYQYCALSGSNSPSFTLSTLNIDYGTLSGTVRDVDNLPAERKVRVYRRATGELVGETMSDSVTGSYSIIIPTQDPGAYDVQFMIEDGELLNDLFYARATPQPV